MSTKRFTKRQRILSMFLENVGHEFSSNDLHATFGSAFRSRVSELNRDPWITIVIKNNTTKDDVSTYWSEYKQIVQDLKNVAA